jgi:membrane-bound metal-dependent hydrolase YbcI (DUF457 family)
MPSPVGHTLAAYAAMLVLDAGLITSRYKMNLAIGAAFIFGTLADADFVVAQFTTIPYLRHHYFSHSIPFAAALTLLIWALLKLFRFQNAKKISIVLGVAYGTHLLLDYLAEDGSKPYGIPLLWPFSHHHFIAPVNIFFSIHRGELGAIFSLHNLAAILIEIAVMAPVAALAFLIVRRKNEIESNLAGSSRANSIFP